MAKRTISSAYEGLRELLEKVRDLLEKEKFLQMDLIGYANWLMVNGDISRGEYRKIYEFYRDQRPKSETRRGDKDQILNFLNIYIEIL